MTTATPAVKTDDGGWTRALDGLGILDTPPEPEFDNIVTLATIICEAPVALVSLIDRDRQWFKARIGFEACQTSLDQSVCVHALADPSLGVFVIPDLSADPRTRENPLVVGEPYLRFYAGARLINPDGQGLGMLCVLDHQPRPGGLTHAQATGLLALANQVISLLTLRQTSAALLDARQAAADLSIGASETRLRLAVEAGQIGEWELDLSTNASIRAPQHDQIFGHPELVEEWGIDTFMAHVLPEDRVATEEAFTRAATTGVGWNFQCRIRRADDGAIRWISAYSAPQLDAEGRAIKLFGMVQDITEQKTAEERLRMLNEDLERQVVERTRETRLYGEIVQSSAAPICAFDTNYRLIAFNRAHSDEFFRIFGYQVQLGEVFPDLFPAAQAATMRALMARALTGETFTVSEAFGDLNLAKPTWEVSYSPLRDGDGRIVGAFHYARDVSVRLRTEAELATTQEALRQAQKMEAIGQLTGGVAHDFNNLLTVIRSSSDLLKRHDLPEERRTRYVAAISDTVDRAAKLTGQLLAFARRQALKPEVFAACESVRGLADMMSTLTGSRVQITTYLPEQTCYVLADLSQFDTALVNMAVNARDAMDGAGRLTIRVAPVEQMPTRRSHAALEGPFVAISINDTGSGIPPERLAQIFEPFFTTKAVGQGTGLGLSQVIGFAKQSGGDVVVESELGRGTTFTIYIPRVTGEALIGDTHEPEPLMDGHGTCVLVVEDNAAVGTFAVQTLTDLGYVPVLAANGDEALTEIAKDADRFDVVFSDVVMPGMSGIDLAQEIRRQHHDLPVLLASGYSHVLAQNGTYGFELLHKPYSVEELSRLLRKVATWKRRKRIVGK